LGIGQSDRISAEERWLFVPRGFVRTKIEAAQPFRKMSRDFARSGIPLSAIGGGESIEQRWRRACQCDLQMERERILIESGHGLVGTK
jgi:hypothetical protein